MHRLIPLVVAVMVFAASGARGQIRDEAEEAAARAADAAAAVDEAEGQRAVVLEDLVTAVADWNAVIGDQTQLAFEVAELRNEVAAAEAEVASLRDGIRGRVVEAYMSGGNGLLDVALTADTVSQVATAQLVLDAVNRRAAAEVASLEAGQEELRKLRRRLGAEEHALDVRTAGLGNLIDNLDILFADADEQVMATHDALVAADAEYRVAYELLQEMIALQRATGAGVERWRVIVEHYFPPDRVEQALEVMFCESRGNPKATHPLSDAAGLFQFMAGTWASVAPQAGFAGASRYDPEANIASAAWLLEFTIERGHPRGDWGRWTCQPQTPP